MAEYNIVDEESGAEYSIESDAPPTAAQIASITRNPSFSPPSQSVVGGEGSFISQAEKEVESSFGEELLKEAPQAVGGIVGGLTGAARGAAIGSTVPGIGTGVGAVLGGVIGAGLGGGGAKGFQQVYQYFTGDPDAPKTSREAAIAMAKAGGEEAAWDLGGNLALKSLSKLVHIVRPKAVEDIAKLSVKLEEAGGSLTAAQRTDSWMVHQLDSLSRGSLSGSGFLKGADVLNDLALKNIEKDLRGKVARNATVHLSDREVGQLFVNTVNGGKAAHGTVVNELYSGFDELVPTKTIEEVVSKVVNTGLLDASGKPTTKIVSEKVLKEVKPVSTDGLKKSLVGFREQLERIKYAGETPESKKLLDSMLSQDKTLSFGDAQALRSNLLKAKRNLEGTLGSTEISSKVSTAITEITKAMDSAAARESSATLNKYLAIKRVANKGFSAFDNKFIADLINADKKNPARIGETLFSIGNDVEILKAKKAIRIAAVLDKGISYDKVWGQMQSGYLDTVLRRSGKASEVSAGATSRNILEEGLDISGSKLIREFSDPKKVRTLNSVFGKETREDILAFAKIAERTQRKPSGGLGMLIQLTQAGALIGIASGDATLQSIGGVILAPRVLAKILAREGGAKLIATAMQTPTEVGVKSALVTKLTRLVAEAGDED